MTSPQRGNARPSVLDDPQWWRSAVVYQIYPRSFADANGDGTGDVRGMIDRLPYLAELGVDAVWVSPWYPSPLLDGGYDVADYRDISPDYGTLADADAFVSRAHELGLRVLIDLVPNHSSWEHPWFKAAVAAGPGSTERDLFIFRDGRGPGGDEPPNNWGGMFGGPAWTRVTEPDGTPGQWYLHLFDPSQPDWNWTNPKVADEFDSILRFWFDRGVDGFRIDVANSMAKDMALPDVRVDPLTGYGTTESFEGAPAWDHADLPPIHRRWREVADSYADTELGPRVFVAEAYLDPIERLIRYVDPGRLHTTFNFDAMLSQWSADSQRAVITKTLVAHHTVGAPATWVLGNHDNVRVATRYGKAVTGIDFSADDPFSLSSLEFDQQVAAMPVDIELGRRRARAAALLELALPGGAYVYQGEELGLDEVEDLPEDSLQDPTWERSGHTVRGRDGCRVPLPWSGTEPPFGFGPSDRQPWLPQPEHWAGLTVQAQSDDPTSTLNLYRAALAERHANPALGDGVLDWHPLNGGDVVAFTRGDRFACVVNFGAAEVDLPAGSEVIVASSPVDGGRLPGYAAVWLRL
ncbi:glycoside hydrolase family 13 protein [Nigerium massiliense]|uniref:glycoside hydrolase family 13 protein n=1 Tax=Nigerium massiliense TaxID=1522317 RepID=UPI0006940AF2|nr:glycoside hydrolase family 13 protein [Nigerium massiliense]